MPLFISESFFRAPYFEDKYEGNWAEAMSSVIIKEDLSVRCGDEESSFQCCV